MRGIGLFCDGFIEVYKHDWGCFGAIFGACYVSMSSCINTNAASYSRAILNVCIALIMLRYIVLSHDEESPPLTCSTVLVSALKLASI